MNLSLSDIYLFFFSIGPAYFFIIFLVSRFVGNDLGDSIDEIDVPDDFGEIDTGHFTIDDLDEIEVDEIQFDDTEFDEFGANNILFKVNYFSPKIWAIILCGFGFGGYSALKIFKVGNISSLVFGGMTGLFIGTLLFGILSYLYSNSSINDLPLKLEGRNGIVTLSIPYKKIGLVRVDFLSGNQEFRAKSVHKRKLKKGEEVKILNYDSKKHLLIVRENK